MAVEVLRIEKISGGGKYGRRKGIGSAIHQKRANRGSIKIKESEEKLFSDIIRVGAKRRKRGSRKFRER